MKTRAKAVRCWAIQNADGSIEIEGIFLTKRGAKQFVYPGETVIRVVVTPAVPKPGGKGKR